MKRSIKFYRDILGFSVMGKLVLQDGNFLIVYLKTKNGAIVELFEYTEKGKPLPAVLDDHDFGYKHMCFSVDDVDSYASYLKSHDVKFLVEPKNASTTPLRLAFFQDPDGNKIEITAGNLELLPYED
jgi:catechol 2,3-dioxygenase-like lactoylglutathione lyase family enzyme